MSATSVDIIEVKSKAQEKAFIGLPYRLYRGEPNWRAPLRIERAVTINPKKNPGLNGIDFQLFLAARNGDVVGRIAAIRNTNHLALHKDDSGHFGFLDTEDDSAIVNALIMAAENWLKARGLAYIVGPVSFSINEEVGLPVSGFDRPPMLMMPYNRPSMPGFLETLGFEKAKDVHAYFTTMERCFPMPPVTVPFARYVEKTPNIDMRPMRRGKFIEDVAIAMDIFNDAWSENWGFIPFSEAQIKHMAKALKPLIDPDMFWITTLDGRPTVFALIIPDLYEAINGLDGNLLPFGWAQFLYWIGARKGKKARLPLMGLRREYHNTRKGLAMVSASCTRIFEKARERGIEEIEMSWILEDNKNVVGIIEQVKGRIYKTYRIYKKPIG